MSHVFGPVPSRRLGRSLGVDLVPFKTCSYDCTYCQLGRTTTKTCERREWVPLEVLLEEVRGSLASEPDYITLSGSGEPTLYARLDELIVGIQAMTDTPVAVLTNGSMLWLPEVRRQLLGAQLVLPSLDVGTDHLFQTVNRPHASLSFEQMLGGLVSFRQEYRGAYWLEVLLLEGISASDEEVDRIADHVRRIRPDRVQLNTATRPTADLNVRMVGRDRLVTLARHFDPPAEVIAEHPVQCQPPVVAIERERVRDLLMRRPCNLGDIALGLGLHRNQVAKMIESLVSEGMIECRLRGDSRFYSCSQPTTPQDVARWANRA